ncbi:MAG: penicillin-binding protein 1A [Gammaproteobacteria bacterium]
MTKVRLLITALIKGIAAGCATLITLVLIAATIGYEQLRQLNEELPDIEVLRKVQYQTPLTIYSREGLLMAEFGEKKCIPVPIENVPQQLINAFLAAEDDSFFTHPGIDYSGLIRASLQYLQTGRKKQGGSTITMQVVRNFLLSREKTFKRKFKEIILALKIDREFSKQNILELYLNKIYLGQHAYGIAAAAQVYYGKTLDQLTLAETAMIAGLPKAPSIYNPVTDPEKALIRRNYVLERMLKLGFITQPAFEQYSKSPVTAKFHLPTPEISAPYVAEMVRQEMLARFGEEAYTLGLKVYTTIDEKLQASANRSIQLGLHEYDERHGYRRSGLLSQQSFSDLAKLAPLGDTIPALVKRIDNNTLIAQLQDRSLIEIPWKNIRWAREFVTSDVKGAPLHSIASLIKPADIIRIRKLTDNSWKLTQIPEAEGALVSLRSTDGAILALTGGFDFHRSKFNRATQSKRQPGSGFKPIIYTAALEQGYNVASMINDAPLVLPGATKHSFWRPENYGNKFLGPTSIRTALTKSRNLVSIRLLIKIGLEKTIDTAQRFGFIKEQLPRSYTLALGSGYASPLDMARLYAVFANGGFLVTPYFIDRIENSDGSILFQAKPAIACPQCGEALPQPAAYARRVISPEVNFLMNSLLRDVVQKGTATAAKELGRNDLAGKTGTTNEQRDAWFNGFVPSLVTTTWVGYDSMQPLGEKETGGHVSLPMWIHFMREALQNVPESPLIPPPGIVKAYIDPHTGLRMAEGNGGGIWEYFASNTVPQAYVYTEDDFETPADESPTHQSSIVESLF